MNDITNPFFDDDDDEAVVTAPVKRVSEPSDGEATLVSIAEKLLYGSDLDEVVELALEVKIPRYMTDIDGSRYYDGPVENTPPAVLALLGSELGNRFLVSLFSKRTEEY